MDTQSYCGYFILCSVWQQSAVKKFVLLSNMCIYVWFSYYKYVLRLYCMYVRMFLSVFTSCSLPSCQILPALAQLIHNSDKEVCVYVCKLRHTLHFVPHSLHTGGEALIVRPDLTHLCMYVPTYIVVCIRTYMCITATKTFPLSSWPFDCLLACGS